MWNLLAAATSPGSVCLALSLGLPQQERPNVLLVIADDLNNEFVEVYDEGPATTQPPTPTLNALAAEGIRFDNAYSNPVCSSTRATIETGLYSYRTGIGWAIKLHESEFLDPRETTLPEALFPCYSSYLLGKWHLGRRWEELDPIVHGYSIRAGSVDWEAEYDDYLRTVAIPWRYRTENEQDYLTTHTTDDALQVIQGAPEPWFVQVSYNAPHKPYHVPPRHLHSYDDPRTEVEMYGAMVEALDTELGRLLTKVDREDTVILFVGDNGSPGDVVSKRRRGKATLFEGGINVPLIVAGCAVPTEQHGDNSLALVNTADIHPTILELAGLRRPTELDGVSFVPVLEDPLTGVRDWVYAERWTPDGSVSRRAARDERYKLIVNLSSGKESFHDLWTAPPGEDGAPILLLNDEQQRSYLRLREIIDRPDA